MKTFSKVLSMVLLVAMCLSLMGGAASATFDPFAGPVGQPTGGTVAPQGSNAVVPQQGSGVTNSNGTDGLIIDDVFTDKDPSLFSAADGAFVQDANGNKWQNVALAIQNAGSSTTYTLTGNGTDSNAVNLSNKTLQLGGHTWTANGGVSVSNTTLSGGTVAVSNSISVNGNLFIQDAAISTNGANPFSGSGTVYIQNTNTLINDANIFNGANVVVQSGKFADHFTEQLNSHLAPGSVMSESGGVVTVSYASGCVTAGGQTYASLQAAYDAGHNYMSIIKSQNAVQPGDLTIQGRSVTIDLNGEQINSNITVASGTGSLTLQNGQLTGTVTLNSGSLILNGGNFINCASVVVNGGMVSNSGSNVTVSSLTVAENAGANLRFTAGNYTIASVGGGKNTIQISGGTFRGGIAQRDTNNYNITGGNFDDEAVRNRLGAGYQTMPSSGTPFDVQPKGSMSTVTQYYSGSYTYTLGSNASGSFFYNVNLAAGDSFKQIDLIDGEGNTKTLAAGSDYAMNGNVYSINKAAFQNFGKTGYICVQFVFNNGVDKDQYVTVSGNGGSVIPPWNPDQGGGVVPPVNPSPNPGNPNPNPGYASVWAYNGRSHWESGDDPLVFCYNAKITGPLKINGFTVSGEDWRDYGFSNYSNGSFYLGKALLARMQSGTHTLTITTEYGEASCNFSIGATLRAVETDRHVTGSSRDLTFYCSEPIANGQVYVGGTQVTNTSYNNSYRENVFVNGNYVTLRAAWLNERSAGQTYTISVKTNSGSTPSTTFRILSRAEASGSPATGDNSNIALWAGILLISGIGTVAVLPRLKKDHN